MIQHVALVTVTASGTPVQVTTTSTPAQTIFFQQSESNTGKLYICDSATADITTLSGVVAVIPMPTTSGGVATVLPYAAISKPDAPAALNPIHYYVDADQNGDTCLVSVVS